MDKRQLIEEIRKHNSSAEESFLDQFEERELRQYLEHLQDAAQNRPRIGGWSRSPREFRKTG